MIEPPKIEICSDHTTEYLAKVLEVLQAYCDDHSQFLLDRFLSESKQAEQTWFRDELIWYRAQRILLNQLISALRTPEGKEIALRGLATLDLIHRQQHA